MSLTDSNNLVMPVGPMNGNGGFGFGNGDGYENSRADIREGLERLMMNSKSEHERMEIRDMLDKLH